MKKQYTKPDIEVKEVCDEETLITDTKGFTTTFMDNLGEFDEDEDHDDFFDD